MTDFRNVKLKVLSREHSAAFQEAAFENGVKWSGGEQGVWRTGAKYLFIVDGLEPRLTWSESLSSFENSTQKEILFTTPAYLNTKIKVRDKKHLDFVLEKLKQNGVKNLKSIPRKRADKGCYLITNGYGVCVAISSRYSECLSDHKEIFIEKVDMEPGDTTKTIGKLVVDVEADITTRFTDTETSDGSTDGYEKLTDVLQAAQNQAAHGKGRDRHANNLPFHEQRMQTISKLIKSPKGMEFQAIKKLTEGMQFDDHDRREAELLGAINYIAGIVIYFRESKDENQ